MLKLHHKVVENKLISRNYIRAIKMLEISIGARLRK